MKTLLGGSDLRRRRAATSSSSSESKYLAAITFFFKLSQLTNDKIQSEAKNLIRDYKVKHFLDVSKKGMREGKIIKRSVSEMILLLHKSTHL